MFRLILMSLIAWAPVLHAVENDIAFLIDFSDQADQGLFQQLVLNVATDLNTTENKVAIYIYSDEPSRLHALTDEQSLTKYLDGFNNRGPSTTETNTAKAIEGATNTTFSVDNAGRFSTIILVTNGGAVDMMAAIQAANAFKTDKQGYIYVVAYNVDMNEVSDLKEVASDPDDTYYLSANSTADLAGIRTALGASLGAEPVTPEPTTMATTSCENIENMCGAATRTAIWWGSIAALVVCHTVGIINN